MNIELEIKPLFRISIAYVCFLNQRFGSDVTMRPIKPIYAI